MIKDVSLLSNSTYTLRVILSDELYHLLICLTYFCSFFFNWYCWLYYYFYDFNCCNNNWYDNTFLPLQRKEICRLLCRHIIFSINWRRYRKQTLFSTPSRDHILAPRHQYGQYSGEYTRRGHMHRGADATTRLGKLWQWTPERTVTRLHSLPPTGNVFHSTITQVYSNSYYLFLA